MWHRARATTLRGVGQERAARPCRAPVVRWDTGAVQQEVSRGAAAVGQQGHAVAEGVSAAADHTGGDSDQVKRHRLRRRGERRQTYRYSVAMR
jgi:hypothetical protein